jgi:hypothetical protein
MGRGESTYAYGISSVRKNRSRGTVIIARTIWLSCRTPSDRSASTALLRFSEKSIKPGARSIQRLELTAIKALEVIKDDEEEVLTMRIAEVIEASGHPKISARHPTTLEITKEDRLTERGDCIIATRASKACVDLSTEFSKLVKNNETRITLRIEAGDRTEIIRGRGSSRLTLDHRNDLVVRKSNYVCHRTIMILANKSASDLNREFVRILRDSRTRIGIELVAEL